MSDRRPVLLDLGCGAGGAAFGYTAVGFRVVGVDIAPQPRYPYEFHRGDMLTFPLDSYAYIHASPPCQHYSDLARRNGNAHEWPDLISPVRERLMATDATWVIENVEGAPLIDPVTLCGTMFPGLRVLRHRLFESNVALITPPHKSHPLVFTYDRRKAHYGKLNQDTSYVQVTGGGNCTVANKRAAMGIPWMAGAELNEAIPPDYAAWIGGQLK